MKKLLFVFMFVLGTLGFAKEEFAVAEAPKEPVVEKSVVDGMNFYVRTGVTAWSDYHVRSSSVDGDGVGYETSLELTKKLEKYPNLEVGLGVGFHSLADGETMFYGQRGAKYEDYKSYPIFLTARYTFPVVGDGVTPYVKADLGYAFNGSVKYDLVGGAITGKENIDNGIYAGFGAGIEQNNINVDVMFKTTQGEVDKHDVDSYRILMSVGYRFDLGKYF